MPNLAGHLSTASPSSPLSFSAYMIGTRPARDRAMETIIEEYNRFFRESIKEGSIQASCIELVHDATGCYDPWHPIWRRSELFKGVGIYLPIFLDAGPHRDLGQKLFDEDRPGVLCLDNEGYLSTTNPSKRACFAVIRV